ncbi:hypothetical protein EVAR_86438_1 [Eumeta japonica]|uniref:NADH dehydrogenase [ubiquinone] 1 alpha subcomplex assembly factor 2 n=1 Tax=Eumeta variegata TaxID=151549 RepID=A0A4C1ZSA3_EUMVA|nr:hypothetical protein EVAR_86438_1 [Eumeta japonica]
MERWLLELVAQSKEETRRRVKSQVGSSRARTRERKQAKDYLGNTYFEIPPNPSLGKRKATRWYDPPKGKDFNDPVPPEWEAWLRQRRNEPPTKEEIEYNLAIIKLKQENAAKIEAKRIAEGGSLPTQQEKGIETFPVYAEFKSGKYKI